MQRTFRPMFVFGGRTNLRGDGAMLPGPCFQEPRFVPLGERLLKRLVGGAALPPAGDHRAGPWRIAMFCNVSPKSINCCAEQ